MIYVEFNDYTRLGNWMFQYAAAISLHKEVRVVLNCDYAKKKKFSYKEIFKDLVLADCVPSNAIVVNYDPTTNSPININGVNGDVYLKGLFQSPTYFDVDLVQKTFSPTNDRIKQLENDYGDWLSRPNVTGIHVRRGDYLKVLFANPFVGKKYLQQAVKKIPEANDFIVCSDDIPWCKKFFKSKFPNKNFLFVEGTTEVNDLYLLSRCKNNIISNGTFGWWQSWLNPNSNKRVIAPSMWFGYKLKKEGVNWNDFYYKEVEVINNDYNLQTYILAHYQYWERILKAKLYNACINLKKYKNGSCNLYL